MPAALSSRAVSFYKQTSGETLGLHFSLLIFSNAILLSWTVEFYYLKSIPVRVPITVIKHLDQKQLENGLSALDILVTVHHSGSVQEFKEGSQAEATEELLIGFSPRLPHPLFLENPGAPAWRQHCPQWAKPSCVNQENMLHAHTDSPTCQSDGGIFLVEFPSSQITLTCIKLKKTNDNKHQAQSLGTFVCFALLLIFETASLVPLANLEFVT